jgi:hypothetical protein
MLPLPDIELERFIADAGCGMFEKLLMPPRVWIILENGCAKVRIFATGHDRYRWFVYIPLEGAAR